MTNDDHLRTQPFADETPDRQDRVKTDNKLGDDLTLMMSGLGLDPAEVSRLGGNHPAMRRPDPMLETETQRKTRLRKNLMGPHLNLIERAEHVKAFKQARGMTNQETAKALGCARSTLASLIALLRLPGSVQSHVASGRLRFGHARAILTMEDPESMADLIIRNNLSVRKTEMIARRLRHTDPYGQLLKETAIPNVELAETSVIESLHAKLTVHDRAGHGYLKLHYQNPDHLNEIITRLCRPTDHWVEYGPAAEYPVADT